MDNVLPLPVSTMSPPAAADTNADASAKQFITNELSEIDLDIKHFGKRFEKMQNNIRFASGKQWPGQTEEDTRYVVNIIQNVIRRRVASLYAKNPTVVAKRKPRLDFAVWSEDFEELAAAFTNPQDPFNAAIIQDVMQGMQRRKTLDAVGKTLEFVFRNQINTADREFKKQMKRLVKLVELCAVSYIKIDFQRDMEVKPDVEARIGDLQSRISEIERLLIDNESGELRKDAMEAEELRQLVDGLERQKYILKSEGMLFRFPNPWDIIPSRLTTSLAGFVGCDRLTERIRMTADEIKRIYKVDVSATATAAKSSTGADAWPSASQPHIKGFEKNDTMHEVFIVQNRRTGMVYTICRGCDYFLSPPAPPTLTFKKFYSIFPLTFNDLDDPDSIIPQATVDLLWHQQMEMNRAKEARRQHRIASRPLYAAATGALDEIDKKNFAEHEAHACIELGNMTEGQSVDSKLQMVRKHPIDPNMYEDGSIFNDVVKVVPMGPANLGSVSGGTATEASIAEDSYQGDIGSNADDLDDFLAEVVDAAGHAILMNFSAETVKRIVGPGAVWPEFSADDVVDNIYLDIQAGTSGRPNRAAKAAAIERLYPLLIQLSGVQQKWVVKLLISIIDENIDLAEAYLDGLPSIMAANRAAMNQTPTGNPATDPAAQGGEGNYNMPGREAPARGALPSMPNTSPIDRTGRPGL